MPLFVRDQGIADAGFDGAAVREPWQLLPRGRATVDYPEPVVPLDDGLARFQHARGLAP